jgi:hypothetical protein
MRTSFTLLAAFILTAPAVRAEDKPDYSDLARLIHSTLIPHVPREFEDRSDWGKMIPLQPNLRLPRVRRTIIPVGDRMEMPHGAWKRTKVWLDEPARDVQIRVTELRNTGKDKTRLGLEATIALHGERERQQWRNGLHLFDLTVQADAVVTVALDTEVTVTLNAGKFPPDLTVQPKVLQTRLELKSFDLKRIGPVLLGSKEARDLGEELKGSLQELLRQYEPQVTQKANEAIATGLKDGKAKLSADTLLKLNLPTQSKR